MKVIITGYERNKAGLFKTTKEYNKVVSIKPSKDFLNWILITEHQDKIIFSKKDNFIESVEEEKDDILWE